MLKTTIPLIAFLSIINFALADESLSVLTYHNNAARTGWNASEKILKPSNVNKKKFGLLFSDQVDGQIYGQPLYVSNLKMGSPTQDASGTTHGIHNVLFITTEHDSVYAFDADNPGAALWEDHFLGVSNGVTIESVSQEDVNNCGQITPEIGITDTPVIDLTTQTMYLVAMTKEIADGPVTHFYHRLHALDITTGAEKFGGPVEIQASVPQTQSGDVFNPISYKERCGLVLSNGVVYTFFASHCDMNKWGKYHGWVLGYDAQTLQQKYIFNSCPNGSEASFWASGVAPAVDEKGSLYLMTGNGTFDGPVSQDWGESFLRLQPDGANSLSVADSFTLYNQQDLSDDDQDLGSGGPLLLPDEVGNADHPHLLVGAGKDGVIYLVDRDHMGGYNTTNQDVQDLPMRGREFGIPAYFNHHLYFGFAEGKLSQVKIEKGKLSLVRTVGPTLGFPGTVPSVSSNGKTNGIIWAALGTNKHQVFRAYDANNLKLLYETKTPTVTKFAVPTIINGRVYLGGSKIVQVYGLLTRP
jgi:hypothetical protein